MEAAPTVTAVTVEPGLAAASWAAASSAFKS